MQQAARAAPISPRSITWENWSSSDPTEQIFFKPSKKQTEDYINGALRVGDRGEAAMVSGETHKSNSTNRNWKSLKGRILQMGGLVESQLRMAIDCFEQADLRRPIRWSRPMSRVRCRGSRAGAHHPESDRAPPARPPTTCG